MFLSKDTCLRAYQILGTLHEVKRDPEEQGSVQYISSLRYFLATDEFVTRNKTPCDSKDTTQKELFRRCVANVVDLDGISYTANFRKTINLHESDLCAVGSNFFSVNVVKDSLVDPRAHFSFPRRKKGSELLRVFNGTITIHPSGYDSFAHLLSGKTICAFALCLWLVRNDSMPETNDISCSVLDILRRRYSRRVVDILCPSKSSFRAFISKLREPLLVSQKEVITREDILSAVKPTQTVTPIVLTAHDRLPFVLRLFKDMRGKDEWCNREDGYKDVCLGTRVYFGTLMEEDIRGFDFAAFKDFCLKHTWTGCQGKGWASLSREDNLKEKVDFIVNLKIKRILPSEYWDQQRPRDVGKSFVSELLMKFHPSDFSLCNKLTQKSLAFLGLVDGEADPDFSSDQYARVHGIQAMIRQKMKAMKIQSRLEEDSSDADFLTVDEFLYFVATHEDLIFQQWRRNMKKEIKLENQSPIDAGTFEDFIKSFAAAAKAAGLSYDFNLVKRFVCALLAKPFVVLTGLSGSGKTKLAQAFVEWIAKEGTSCIVPVGADWVNNEKLLGYPNALDSHNYVLPDTGILKLLIDANENPKVPFFLILDEMNLSHVERYFADFLSAMESGGAIRLYDGGNRMADDGTPVPSSLPFPGNLFVIGTMNVDETTHMFSPKVLDRAQVVEFRVTAEQMKSFLDSPQKVDMSKVAGKGLVHAEAFLKLHESPFALVSEDKMAIGTTLQSFFPALAELGAEFAFRTAGEALVFCAYAREAKMSVEEAVDSAVMQKLLPKLHGSRRRLALPLETFWKFCLKEESGVTLGDVCKKDSTIRIADETKFPVSADKICRLYRAVEANGYASYAEA